MSSPVFPSRGASGTEVLSVIVRMKQRQDYTVRLVPGAHLRKTRNSRIWDSVGENMPGKKKERGFQDRLRYFESRLDALLTTIRELVEIESPSDSKPACDRISALLPKNSRSSAADLNCTARTNTVTAFRLISPAPEIQNPFCCSATSIPFTRWARWPKCHATWKTAASMVPAYST